MRADIQVKPERHSFDTFANTRSERSCLCLPRVEVLDAMIHAERQDHCGCALVSRASSPRVDKTQVRRDRLARADVSTKARQHSLDVRMVRWTRIDLEHIPAPCFIKPEQRLARTSLVSKHHPRAVAPTLSCRGFEDLSGVDLARFGRDREFLSEARALESVHLLAALFEQGAAITGGAVVA